MARSIAQLREDLQRLNRILREHSLQSSPLAQIAHDEHVILHTKLRDRLEKRAERKAERHTELDTDDATLAVIQQETDMSVPLKAAVDLWDERLAEAREEVDR
jgi:hypothetical protein